MAKVDHLMLRCDLHEEPLTVVYKFINDLRTELKKEVKLEAPNS